MTNSSLTAGNLAIIFGNQSSNINSFLQDNPGHRNQSALERIKTKIDLLVTHFQANAINDLLDELDDAANRLNRVTQKLETAIRNIMNADRALENSNDFVTAFGQLTSAIQNRNSQDIGAAIDRLLTISLV